MGQTLLKVFACAGVAGLIGTTILDQLSTLIA